MTMIGGLDIPQLDGIPRASWSIGMRPGDPRYFTLHYNGPRVPGFGYVKLEKDQIRNDARWHMRPGALGAKSGGDGVQYHGGTFSDGSSYQFRDWRAILWHASNFEANQWSISWHLALGGDQKPTIQQVRGVLRVIEAFRIQYPSIKVTGVKGHKEWSNTLCPGAFIMPHIIDYRNRATYGTAIQYFVTKFNANCRTQPDVRSPIALDGTAITPAGTTFGADAIVNGFEYEGVDQYVHRADGIGFYHMSVVQSVTYRQYLPLI